MPPTYSTYRHGLNLAGPSRSNNDRSFSQDIYIPTSYEEQQRRGIESQLARSGQLDPTLYTRGRRMQSASSSTIDTYDQIGREDDRRFNDRHARSDEPVYDDDFDNDESLIPGVGRGLRAHNQNDRSPSHRLQLYEAGSQPTIPLSTVKSPYRSRLAAPPHAKSSPGIRRHGTHHVHRPRAARVDTASESGDESNSSATSSSGDDGFESTGNHRGFAATPAGGTLVSNTNRSQVQRRLNRPVLGEDTLERVDFDRYTDSDRTNRASRKKLNEDDPTYTNAYIPATAVRKTTQPSKIERVGVKPGVPGDTRDPFHSPSAAGDRDRTRPAASNAAAYQQHLNSRTLTSPAIRTLVGDRTKSPDSPSPAPSISGRIFNRERSASGGRGNGPFAHAFVRNKAGTTGLPREQSVTAISAFEDMARKLQRDVELTRRAEEIEARRFDDDAATANNSNSGGSGYGAGSQVSSARTRVDSNGVDAAANTSQESGRKRQGETAAAKVNANGYLAFPRPEAALGEEATTTAAYPAHLRPGAPGHAFPGSATRKARLDDPFSARLPDLTGLTSALASPLKTRDPHVPIDPAVGSQFARLEELSHLRVFVDSLQTELDRAGERIVNLEESQEIQKEQVDGLRKEVQSVWQDVREVRDGDFIKTIMERIREEEHLIHQSQNQRQDRVWSQPQQAQQPQPPIAADAAADETSQTHVQAEEHAGQGRPRSPVKGQWAPERPKTITQDDHDEVIHRLYGELDKLKIAMAEQFRKATQLTSEERVTSVETETTSPAAGVARDAASQADGSRQGRASDDRFPRGGDSRDPWEAIEALRVQVVYLAGEVEKLNDVVVSELVETRKASRHEDAFATAARHRKSSASSRSRATYAVHDNGLETDTEAIYDRPRFVRDLHRFEGRGQPASDPAPFESATARLPPRRSTTPPLPRFASTRQPTSQRHQRSRVSFGHEQGDDYDPDETIDAVAENRRRRSSAAAHVADDDDAVAEAEEDISIIAEARAKRAFESMAGRSSRFTTRSADRHNPREGSTNAGRHSDDAAAAHELELEHDPARCTVCSQARKSARRQQSRRDKALAREQARTAHEEDEETLLRLFDSKVPLHLSASQTRVLEKMLHEHWDEFVHQRMLYAELADELKHVSPRMGREKRKILAQHVLDAVETLEVKADRINRLERLIESLLGEGKEAEERAEEETRSAMPISSTAQTNGLRTALERLSASPPAGAAAAAATMPAGKTRLTPKAQRKAMERMSAATAAAQGRNSPPTIDRGA